MSTDGNEITNVSVPTLIPFLNATNPWGPTVVIAPGGGYSILAMEKEGFDVATRMNELGVNAVTEQPRVSRPHRLPPISALVLMLVKVTPHSHPPRNLGFPDAPAGSSSC